MLDFAKRRSKEEERAGVMVFPVVGLTRGDGEFFNSYSRIFFMKNDNRWFERDEEIKN